MMLGWLRRIYLLNNFTRNYNLLLSGVISTIDVKSIYDLFKSKDIEIKSCKMLKFKNSKPMNCALITVDNEEEYKKLTKIKYINYGFTKMFLSEIDDEIDDLVNGEIAFDGHKNYLEITDLPRNILGFELKKQIRDLGFEVDDVIITQNQLLKCNGTGYLFFKSRKKALDLLKNSPIKLNKNTYKITMLEKMPTDIIKLENFLRGYSSSSKIMNADKKGGNTLIGIHLHGIPIETTLEDIQSFFSPLAIESVHFDECSSDEPFKNAVVKFVSSHDIYNALLKNGKPINGVSSSLLLFYKNKDGEERLTIRHPLLVWWDSDGGNTGADLKLQ